MFGWAMVDLAAISFLGLGVQPPAPNWGVMISENAVGLQEGYPLPTLAAGACVVIVVIAFNVLGERLLVTGGQSRRAQSMSGGRRCSRSSGLTVRLPAGNVLRDVSLSIGPGEALGPGRRVRLGQVDDGAGDRPAAAAGRAVPRARSRSTVSDVGDLPAADLRRYRSRGGDDLPGSARAHQPGPADRRLHDRGAARAGRRRARGGAGGRRHARPGRHRRRRAAAAAVPARAVGRDAAAGDDRGGAAHQPAAAAGGRADDRPRRHDAGRGDGDPRRAAPLPAACRCCSSPTTWSWRRRSATGPR